MGLESKRVPIWHRLEAPHYKFQSRCQTTPTKRKPLIPARNFSILGFLKPKNPRCIDYILYNIVYID